MKCLLYSNNPLLQSFSLLAEEGVELHMVEGGYRDVLVAVRDKVYAGHALLTHPLAGSIKPNQTPYRSVMLEEKPRAADAASCEIIAQAIEVYDRFPPRSAGWSEAMLADLRQIDRYLVESAVLLKK